MAAAAGCGMACCWGACSAGDVGSVAAAGPAVGASAAVVLAAASEAEEAAPSVVEDLAVAGSGRKCDKCGSSNTRGAQFCGSCGVPLQKRGGMGMTIGKTMFIGLAGLAVVVLIGGGCGGCMVYNSYKTAIRLDEDVQKTWADVEVVLKRRFDLIPNIVETVRGYATHEKELLQGIADVRKSYFSAGGVRAKAKAASALDGMLSRLMVLRETYPELKADKRFRDLQIVLEGSENRIAEMRKRYNAVAQALNTHIRGPIGKIAAGWAEVERAEYFEAGEEAQENPKVEF